MPLRTSQAKSGSGRPTTRSVFVQSSVIDVGVRKKDVGNPREFGRRQIANARAAIDYHVVIDVKRRGAKLTADPAVATQTSKSHAASP